MMAMTTSNSINVNPRLDIGVIVFRVGQQFKPRVRRQCCQKFLRRSNLARKPPEQPSIILKSCLQLKARLFIKDAHGLAIPKRDGKEKAEPDDGG
jgi:hypothetical protein